MRALIFVPVLMIAGSLPALAASEGKFSKATTDGIGKSLTAAGCKGGQIESGDGFYEISKAECADGLYNIKVDTDFKIIEQKKRP